MQKSKQFKTYQEAMDFKRFHKVSWLHKLFEGVPPVQAGWLVVYIIREE